MRNIQYSYFWTFITRWSPHFSLASVDKVSSFHVRAFLARHFCKLKAQLSSVIVGSRGLIRCRVQDQTVKSQSEWWPQPWAPGHATWWASAHDSDDEAPALPPVDARGSTGSWFLANMHLNSSSCLTQWQGPRLKAQMGIEEMHPWVSTFILTIFRFLQDQCLGSLPRGLT